MLVKKQSALLVRVFFLICFGVGTAERVSRMSEAVFTSSIPCGYAVGERMLLRQWKFIVLIKAVSYIRLAYVALLLSMKRHGVFGIHVAAR